MTTSTGACPKRFCNRKSAVGVVIILIVVSTLGYNIYSNRLQINPLPTVQQWYQSTGILHHYDRGTQDYVSWNYATGLNNNGYQSVDGDDPIYIFSAIAGNSSFDVSWDMFLVNGWEPKYIINKTCTCCFRYPDNNILARPLLRRNVPPNLEPEMYAQQYVCSNPFNNSRTVTKLPVGVTIIPHNQTCPNLVNDYVLPAFPARQTGNKTVICAQVAYGKKSAEELLEWIEYQLLFGVNKILIYANEDLKEEPMRVLQYYEAKGLLQLIPIKQLPAKEKYPRYWSKYSKAKHQDIQVVLFDAQARISSYRYAGIIDTDEFFVPLDGSQTYSEFMENLLKNDPDVAFVSFLVQAHITDWGKTDNESDIFLIQYNNHTQPFKNAVKHVFLPERIVPGYISTHHLEPVNHYKGRYVEPSTATLHHYRHCRQRWQENCNGGFQRIQGRAIALLAKKIEGNIRKVRSKLGLSPE